MRRALTTGLLLPSLTLAGCFYTEPINQRPALDIRPDSSDPSCLGFFLQPGSS